MYRYSIIVALLATAATQASPVNLFSRPKNGLVSDIGMSSIAVRKHSTVEMMKAIYSGENFNTDNLEADVLGPENGNAIEARTPQELTKMGGNRSQLKKFDERDEQVSDPVHIDGILPVDLNADLNK